MEARIKAIEKGISQASLSAATDGTHYQRVEENILSRVREIMTNQILPQALQSIVEPRIRELSIAHEVTGRRVDQLAEVATHHTSLLQDTTESMCHIKDMIRTSTSAQDDMKTMMVTAQAKMVTSQDDMKMMMERLLSRARSGSRRKKTNTSNDGSPQESSDDPDQADSPEKKMRKDLKQASSSSQPTIPFPAIPSKSKPRDVATTPQESVMFTVQDKREGEQHHHEPAIEELVRIWPTLRATLPVSGDAAGHSFGNALRTTSTYKATATSKEVIKVSSPNSLRTRCSTSLRT
jgi:hypothetical protein